MGFTQSFSKSAVPQQPYNGVFLSLMTIPVIIKNTAKTTEVKTNVWKCSIIILTITINKTPSYRLMQKIGIIASNFLLCIPSYYYLAAEYCFKRIIPSLFADSLNLQYSKFWGRLIQDYCLQGL